MRVARSFYVPASDEMNSAIGRLTWASLNLQHAIRHLYQYADGGDRPWPRGTFGHWLKVTRDVLHPESQVAYDQWMSRHGDPGRVARNAILHGIPGWHWENADEPVVSTMTAAEVGELAEQLEDAMRELEPLLVASGVADFA